MNSAVRQRLRRLRERLPEPQILLVPGHFFYTHRFEIAAGMSRTEIEAFLALSLEGAAPFPLEHLAWGFYYRPGESHALVFATTRQRLKTLGELELEGFYHAFAGFVTLLGETADRAKVRYLSQNGAISALFFEAGGGVPCRIVSREIVADVLTDEVLLAHRKRLDAEIDTSGFYVEDGLWVGDGVAVDAKGLPVFQHRRLGVSTEETLPNTPGVDDRSLWGLDLRDALYATRHRKERLFGQRLWGGVQALAALLVLLCVLQIGTWALSRATDWIDTRLFERYPDAEQITKNKQFIERLASDSAQSLDPVQMLTAVNNVRPASIYFQNAGAAKAEEGPGMVLHCKGECREGAGTVNAYADRIRALASVLAVSQNVDIRDGRTYFEMDVTFDPARLAMESATARDVARNPSPTEP